MNNRSRRRNSRNYSRKQKPGPSGCLSLPLPLFPISPSRVLLPSHTTSSAIKALSWPDSTVYTPSSPSCNETVPRLCGPRNNIRSDCRPFVILGSIYHSRVPKRSTEWQTKSAQKERMLPLSLSNTASNSSLHQPLGTNLCFFDSAKEPHLTTTTTTTKHTWQETHWATLLLYTSCPHPAAGPPCQMPPGGKNAPLALAR